MRNRSVKEKTFYFLISRNVVCYHPYTLEELALKILLGVGKSTPAKNSMGLGGKN